jgi:ribonucleoside-diphosphate reductase alpha chain
MDDISVKILSDITVFTKYSKYLPNKKRRETWDELIKRNMFMHMDKYPSLQTEIVNAYQYVFDKKVLPSMRSLQFAGRAIEANNARIFNCSYAPIDDYFVFAEIMFLLLAGCGVGYSVQTHHIEKLPNIKPVSKTRRRHLIQDSIEGWADAVKVLVKAYFFGLSYPVFDYTGIREKGSPLKTAGGKAPGPDPLRICLEKTREIFESKEAGSQLTSLEVHDIICILSDAVLAGGIRRSSLIALFSVDDEAMLKCKEGEWWIKNPQRARANNSVVLLRHRIHKNEFMDLWKTIEENKTGEPGLFFSNNADNGTNPCCEIGLKPFQFCNLVSINASNIKSQEDLNNRSKAAAFIATLQAGYTDFHYLRDIWKKTTDKEALLGVSMTGIASGDVLEFDLVEAAEVVKKENERVAKVIGINKAARLTAVKPEGTTSLVLGTSSGIHAWHAPFYIRRMRILKNEPIYEYIKDKLPELVEDDFFNKENQAILSIPIKAPKKAKFRDESALEMLERVKKVSVDWVRAGHRRGDNTHNVSATISIKKDEWKEVGEWMWNNKGTYNGLSVLPADENHGYVQMPFEEITEAKYDELVLSLKAINLTEVIEEDDNTKLKENLACAGGSNCEVM